MKTRFLLLLVSALLIVSAGCLRARPGEVATPSGNIEASAGKKLTAQDMREAIIKGCAITGWRTSDIDAGTLEAKLDTGGKHVVVVSIAYTATSWAINYKSSENMNYDAKNADMENKATINRNYNHWVHGLNENIRIQVSHKQAGR